jgi:hypothetical protein
LGFTTFLSFSLILYYLKIRKREKIREIDR